MFSPKTLEREKQNLDEKPCQVHSQPRLAPRRDGYTSASMAFGQIERVVLPDGAVRMTADSATFEFARPKTNVLVITVTGYDKGQFATAPFDEIGSILRVAAPLELFIDAQKAVGATVRVSKDWTSYLARHKGEFSQAHVLTGSKMVELTVAIARHLSGTGNLVQLYSDPEVFAAQLAAALRRR
jgi:hypothetical protein